MIRAATRLVMLILATGSALSQNTYKDAAGREVIAHMEPVEGQGSDLSNSKCIEYKVGAPKDFSKGCISAIYFSSGQEKVERCSVDFDDTDCNSCTICETTDEVPKNGFSVNCNNVNPAKTFPAKDTDLACVPFEDDQAIKSYLLQEGHFSDIEFEFAELVEETEEPDDSSGVVSAFSTAGLGITASMALWIF